MRLRPLAVLLWLPLLALTAATAAAQPVPAAVVDDHPVADHTMAGHAVIASSSVDQDFRRGLAYRNGDGVTRDAVLAVQALTRAAERGVPAAMFILSHMLAEGEGAARDMAAARRWLEMAAQAEYPEALQEMAMTERDPARAAELVREAAHAMQHRAHER
jgi:TPR repeat protein